MSCGITGRYWWGSTLWLFHSSACVCVCVFECAPVWMWTWMPYWLHCSSPQIRLKWLIYSQTSRRLLCHWLNVMKKVNLFSCSPFLRINTDCHEHRNVLYQFSINLRDWHIGRCSSVHIFLKDNSSIFNPCDFQAMVAVVWSNVGPVDHKMIAAIRSEKNLEWRRVEQQPFSIAEPFTESTNMDAGKRKRWMTDAYSSYYPKDFKKTEGINHLRGSCTLILPARKEGSEEGKVHPTQAHHVPSL